MTLFTTLLVLIAERLFKLGEHWQLDHRLEVVFRRIKHFSLPGTLLMTLVAVAAPLCIFTPYFNALPPYWNVAAIIASFSLIAIMCLSWLYTICVVIAEAFPVKNVASVVGITAGAGAVGGAEFNIFIGSLLVTMGNVLFAVMGVMHLVTAVILWRMVRHETPKTVK